jgi:hypothetical protein
MILGPAEQHTYSIFLWTSNRTMIEKFEKLILTGCLGFWWQVPERAEGNSALVCDAKASH